MTEFRTRPTEGIPPLASSPAEFRTAADRLAAGSGPFAIDTERASSFRYNDRAFLIQIRRRGAGTVLIDPEGDRSAVTEALAPVLTGQDWVLHAAASDLPCLAWLGLYPGTLFDTEVAARLAGFARPNLGGLILELFDIELEKGYSAADWSARPLNREELAYAALDVELLLELAELLKSILAEQDKLNWALEEFDHIVTSHEHIDAPSPGSWRDLKGVGALRTPQQLAVARALWTRRDELAASTDQSPSRVLPNKVLVEIARSLATTPADVARIPNLPRKRNGAPTMWAGVAAAALAAPPATWPAREKSREAVPAKSVWARDYPQQWETFLGIRAEVDELAEELGMAAELLIRPATLRELVWVRLVALAPARSKAASRGSSDKQVQTIDDAERFLQRAGARAWQIELVLPAVAPYLFC